MKPICVGCQRFYRMKKAGYYFIEAKPKIGHGFPPPGTAAPQDWEPYKLWSGDLWECQGCGHDLISGVGYQPVAEYYQEEFDHAVQALEATQFTVNDC
jgi:hypothetical protein